MLHKREEGEAVILALVFHTAFVVAAAITATNTTTISSDFNVWFLLFLCESKEYS